MKLTPLDIRRQQFARKTFGGYDTDEVDGFLKQLADQWEGALDDVRTASERAADFESKLKHYERVELALQEALETARDTGRRAEAMAEQKARLTIEEAEMRARQILQDAERDRHGMRQDLVKLTSRQNEIGARLRGFLLSELEILAQYQGDDPVGFIKLQPANPAGGDYRLDATPEPHRLGHHEAPDEDLASSYAPYTEAPRAARDPEPANDAPADAPAEMDDAPPEAVPVEPVQAEPMPSRPTLADSFIATPAPEPAPEPPPSSVEPSTAEPSTPEPAPAELADEAPSSAPAWAPDSPPRDGDVPAEAPAPSWNLRSLVTGEGGNVAASEAERDRIRRILDDLD